MKKIISVLLSLLIILSAVACVIPASASTTGLDIPVIYIEGQGASLYRNYGTPEQEQIYPIQIPDGYIEEKVEEFLPVFTKAFFTQEWDEFCVTLYEIITPLLADVRLNSDGEPADNSVVGWTWSESTLRDKKVNGKYAVDDYIFKYDWRLDPLKHADDLHAYIEAVKKVTGAEKVNLIGRCLGASIVAAYLTKYDGEHINEVLFYAEASHGAAMASKAYSGDLYLESDGIERYVYDIQLFEDETIESLIESILTLLNKTYGLDIACWAVNNVYKDIYLDIVPPVMIESFGTYPGYWSMVAAKDYDKAMETVFYGADKEEYSGLIEKIENYHKNVRLVMDDKYLELAERGIQFSNICKYGFQIMPVSSENHLIADNTCSIDQSSMGATASDVTETLSDEYIECARRTGTFKYISPDMQIDASTCLFPDSTWFIKNLDHQNFPDSVEYLFLEIFNNDNYTVFDNEKYPQYLVYENDTSNIVPMTAENMDTTSRWNVSFIDALTTFFKSFYKIISTSVQSKLQSTIR